VSNQIQNAEFSKDESSEIDHEVAE